MELGPTREEVPTIGGDRESQSNVWFFLGPLIIWLS